jgi:hypothetical protein
VSELINTIIPPDDGLGDFNTPTVNQDYRLHEEQDIDLVPLEPNVIDHETEVLLYQNLEDIDPLQNPQENLEPDQPQPREQIQPKVLDQGASTPHRSQRTRTKPE